MEKIPLDLSEFQKVLTGPKMLAYHVIPIIFFVSVTMFLGVNVIDFCLSSAPEEPVEDNIAAFLSLIAIFWILCIYLFSYVVFRCFTSFRVLRFIRLIPRERTASGAHRHIEARCFWMMAAGNSLRFILLSWTALYGIVLYFMAIVDGLIYTQRLYWLNLIWYVLLAVVFVKTFPTKKRLGNLFRKRFLKV